MEMWTAVVLGFAETAWPWRWTY